MQLCYGTAQYERDHGLQSDRVTNVLHAYSTKHTARLWGYGNMYSLLCFKEAAVGVAWSCLSASVAAQRVLTFLFFFFGAGSEDRCKTESTLYGVEEARIVMSEVAVLQTTISWR